MTSLTRGTQRLGLVLESSAKLLKSRTVRHASQAVAKCKIVEGNNGEKIFTSPYGELNYPKMTVAEYVWQNFNKYPNTIALECGVTGRKFTYAEARDASNYVARSLRNLGLREGDIVAVILPNLPECAISFLGILEAGIVMTMVNPFYTVDEITKQLVDSGAKAVITSSEIAPAVLAAAKNCLPPNAPKIVVEDGVREIPDGTIPFKDLITRGKTLPPLPDNIHDPERLAALPYSSGTTGLPKGVELTHNNLVSNIAMVHDSLDARTFENCTKDIIPVILPLFHIYGMNVLLLPRLALGSTLITLPRFTPEGYVGVLEKHKCTQLFCVPPIVLFLAASPYIKKKHFENVRSIFSGAAPLAKSDVERVYEKFGVSDDKLRFLQGYGMTECSAVSFLETSNSKYASIGHPICGSEARLVDPMTNQDVLTPGQTGELWIKGPHIMKAYKNNEEATREAIKDGWLKTGDIAYFDDELDFFITDRLKELVKVKGFQVPPAELEAILRTHPDVAEAAVTGIPDARSGEVPKAFILRKKGTNPSEEDIQNFLKGKVAEYKELKGGVTFVDSIPRNPSGKILRIKLKEMYVK